MLCHKEGKKVQVLSKKKRLDEGATAGRQAKSTAEKNGVLTTRLA